MATFKKNSVNFNQAARACAIKVLAALVGLACAIALLGWVIDHADPIGNGIAGAWQALLLLISLGGHLWAAVAFGVASLGVFAWVGCVGSQMGENTDVDSRLILIAVLSVVVFVLALCSLHTTFENFKDLTTYQSIAVVVMHIPIAVCILGCIGCAMTCAMTNEE